MSKHRASRREVRPPRRMSILALALGVTIVVGGTAVGVLPQLRSDTAAAGQSSLSDAARVASSETSSFVQVDPPAPDPASDTDLDADAVDVEALQDEVDRAADPAVDPGLPADSGDGRRIVFSESDQRVWLVGDDGSVERSYLVSGSRFDNLDPGTYAVQSKTRQATAFDYSGTMEYFVRFATGFSEPIGFHSVPRDNSGVLEQTKAQLGTPLSAGCVRQWEPDAIALWEFAPVGTTVVVTA
ncbi:L,D-transpeptidase [Aeromicrobium fastidiosum]|uniref:L,D-transpeptidase n=1 Tax=Aeromicrobium fastidiosum TaxID=52699 RepID=UPI00165FF3E3|nr:L,D-transpeptidase [Aeromicrobium fastidiosum]MBP2391004.1 lipoprotein-anchoring transpeptidase ErfK/SrfK [Aeromicrobium fastidiosum]